MTASAPVFALPVVVIELPFRALLMPLVGPPPLPTPGVIATGVAAIAMSPITVRADEEDRVASLAGACSLKENCFAVSRCHALSQADLGLVNGTGLWQVRTSVCLVSNLMKVAELENPVALTAGFFPFLPPS